MSLRIATKKNNPKVEYKTGVNEMGLVYAEIELFNAGELYNFRKGEISEDEVKQVKVNALVDSGSYMLTINDTIQNQLGLPLIEKQFSVLADDTEIEVEVVGPVEVRFENRRTSVDAIIIPNSSEVLLGAIPMEDMDVLIDPRERRLVVNPKHPYVATKYLK
ncbi:MAG: clan AA aspartic protease [Pyrinomonadaceae bacterium]